METTDLLRHFSTTCKLLGLRYLVTGSVATSAYGEPRYTRDIDIVVELPQQLVDEFCSAFPSESFYVSRKAAAEAVARRHQFNILHFESGLKIDVIVATSSDFDRSRFARGRTLEITSELSAVFASPEDVALKKMVYFQEGGSTKHLRDIVGMLSMQGDQLDRAYLREWAERLGVTDVWNDLLPRMDAPG